MRMTVSEVFAAAFPAEVRADAVAPAALVPPADLKPAGHFSVTIEGSFVTVPYRIYNPEPRDDGAANDTQRSLLDCLYTRHHDGFARQRHLRSILKRQDYWAVPFVVQLLGEYVLAIVEDIEAWIQAHVQEPTVRHQLGRFAHENPAFMDLTQQRALSYWDAYYRFGDEGAGYRLFANYPAAAISTIRRLGSTFGEG